MSEIGAHDAGIRLAESLITTLRDPLFLPELYPDMFNAGIDEGSLHAYMLSALVLVGERLGLSPVSDAPVFDRLDTQLIGEGAKRPDAVWFARGTRKIRCLIEFERYSNHSLLPKARNLLIMGKEIQPPPELVILNYWTYSPVAASALQPTLATFARGFTHPSTVHFSRLACPALVLETLVVSRDGHTRIDGFMPRIFVHNGEDKPYVIRHLGSL